MFIEENIKKIKTRMAQTGQKVDLIAVSKTFSVEDIELAIKAGIKHIGENRVQEALPKIEALKQKYPDVTWHMIGHLQRNKVKQVVGKFDLIQSVDSERLAKEINERAKALNITIPVLLEVNTSLETSKDGISPDLAISLLQNIAKFSSINIQGLMTIGPLSANPEDARPCFKKLRKLSEEIKKLSLPNVDMKYLSMGMTDDFEVAIQEGSNMIRVGRAIFGVR